MVVKEFSETPWLVNKVFVRLSSRTVDTLLTFWFCAVMFSQVAESRYRSADPRNVNRLDHPLCVALSGGRREGSGVLSCPHPGGATPMVTPLCQYRCR